MGTTKKQTEFSGMLGEVVSVRKVNGRVVVTNRPKRKQSAPSEKQQAFKEKFLQAAQYAKRQSADAESKALYATGISNKKPTAYIVALIDYLKAPKVIEIKASDYEGAVGDVITIDATDDFKVTRVRVSILGKCGNKLERGEAIQHVKNPNLWSYKATVANPAVKGSTIVATAIDIPENETTLEKVL